jgi:hypothetical protein
MDMVKMKGQIFILISIFVLLFLFSLRIGTESVEIGPGDTFYEDFSNLKNELIRTVDISLINQESLQGNLDNFVAFSKDFYARKGYTENVEYSVSALGDVTTIYLNVSLNSTNSYLMQGLIINRTLSVFV